MKVQQADELRVLIKTKISSDPTLQTLMGGTPSDPRLYWYYPPTVIVIDTAHPAYLVYHMITSPEENDAMTQPVFAFNIWSKKVTESDSVMERFDELFHEKTLIGPAPASRKIYSKVLFRADAYQEAPILSGRVFHLRLSYLNIE